MTGSEKEGMRVGLDLGQLREVRPAELAVRFAFGAGISLAAALVGMRFGHRAGGLFLAFPAILPASLTLISDKHGRREAKIDAIGAVLGGVALGGFALTALLLLTRLPLAVALLLAALFWVVGAVALYFGAALLLARNSRAAASPDRAASLAGPQAE